MPDEKPKSLEASPLDSTNASKGLENEVLQGIVKNASNELVGGDLLDEAPEVDLSLLTEVKPKPSILLYLVQGLFTILVLLFMTSFLFFSSQLSNFMEPLTTALNLPNISKSLSSVNAQILALQTDLNFYRLLQAKAYLDEFSYYGDSFIQNYEFANSKTASSSDRDSAKNELNDIKPKLSSAFNLARDKYINKFKPTLFQRVEQSPTESEQIFRERLKTKIDQEGKGEDKNLLQAKRLVGNNSLYAAMMDADIDAMSDGEIYEFLAKINPLISNDLSSVQKIKERRIKWSDVMNEVENVTFEVDKFFNSETYDELGGIRYTSYDLDSEAKAITINGETKNFDTNNFTIIADLIDKLNASPIFEDGEMRSFNKSGNAESGYKANLRMTLGLEKYSEERNKNKK